MRYRRHGKDLYLGGSQGLLPFIASYIWESILIILWLYRVSYEETLPMKIWVKYILPQDNRASHFCYHGKSTLVSLSYSIYIYSLYITYYLVCLPSLLVLSFMVMFNSLYTKSHICFRPVKNYLPNLWCFSYAFLN